MWNAIHISLNLLGAFTMKKLITISFIVSLSLVSVSSFAGPAKKNTPVVEAEMQEAQSFSDWFLSLFDF